MEELDLIGTAHGIDHHLGRLAAAVTDRALKERVLSVRDGWRELAYALTAEVCGLEPRPALSPPRRRGRRRKADGPTGEVGTEEDQDVRVS